MSKLTLRPHQTACVDALRESVRNGGIPYADCTVGFGKSLVMAEITNLAMRNGLRVLQITPSRELCKQNFEETFNHLDNNLKPELGIVCAGLNKKQTHKQAIICTFGSMLNRRTDSGSFDIVLADECHGVSHNEDTSIRKILRSLARINPKMKVMGLSGSPYRFASGALENDCIEGKAYFTECAYTSNIKELIQQGYLAHVESISGDIQADMDGVPMSGQDYDSKLMSARFEQILSPAVADMKLKFKQHNVKSAVIYTSSIANAQHVVNEWGTDSDEIRMLHGETPQGERSATLKWLKEGEGNRYVVNVALLILGYNNPCLNAIVFFRATKSLVIFVQCIGRILRPHDSKEKGLVLDYGGNIERFGAIDNITPPKPKKKRGEPPKKLCTAELPNGNTCNHPNPLPLKKCQKCQAEFILDPERPGEYSMRTKAMVLSESEMTYEIVDIEVEKAYSKKTGDAMIKMFMYGGDGFELIHTHYLCLNHTGYAKDKADRFVMALFKKQETFYELGTVGTSVDNVMKLMVPDMYDNFFKKIVEIKLSGEGKFKDLVGLEVK